MKQDETSEQQIPAWKKHGRNGPFDWWLGCREHGGEFAQFCFSCWIAADHNERLAAKLASDAREAGGE